MTVQGANRDVCGFTVAANRFRRDDAEFVRVSVWGKQAESCQKYLAKGRKVFVTGEPSARAWTGNDGNARASLEMTAERVVFLTPKGGAEQGEAFRQDTGLPPSDQNGFVEVDGEELPF